jgi:hypothetical protein
MSERKIPSGGPPSQSELPRCSREFVQEASKLYDLHFSKPAVLDILKHSGAVFEFVKVVGLLKFVNIDDYVMQDLIAAIWEDKIS